MNAPVKKLSVGRGMNRRITKAGETAMKRFDTLVIAVLRSLEATPPPDGQEYLGWTLDTKAGAMTVNPHGYWIHCRFHDVDRAREALCVGQHDTTNVHHLNVYSGKWNHHYDLGAAEREVEEWKVRLQRVVDYWQSFALAGRRLRGWSGKHNASVIFNIESYGTRHGFWVVNENDPSDRHDISERAIGRTFFFLPEPAQ